MFIERDFIRYIKNLFSRSVAIEFLLLAILFFPCSTWANDKIAVYGFKAIGVPNSVSIALQENIESELVALKTYEVFSRTNLEDILRENAFQQTGACDENSCLIQAGQIAGIAKMLTGSVSKIGFTYNLVYRIIDISTGKIDKSAAFKYDGNDNGLLTFSSESVKSFFDPVQQTLSIQTQQATQKTYVKEKSPVELKLESMQQNNTASEKSYNRTMTVGVIIGVTAVGIALALFFANAATH